MSENARADYTRTLSEALQAKAPGQFMPAHVLNRVTAVIFPRPVVFADMVTEPDTTARAHLRGRVIAFTPSTVVVADFTGVMDAQYATGHHEEHDDAQVDVEVIPRNALQQMSLEHPDNRVQDWQLTSSFPGRGQLALRYRGQDQPILLPLSHRNTEGLDDLIDTLTDDLSATPGR